MTKIFLKMVLLFSLLVGWNSIVLAQSTWEIVGSTDIASSTASHTSLAVDSKGVPYVAYQDWDDPQYGVTVIKYDGDNWVNVGSPGFSESSAGYIDIVIDKNDIPYVAFADGQALGKATVMKFDGTDWVNVGSAGFSEDDVNHISIDINDKGYVYILYADDIRHNYPTKLTVMRYINSTLGWGIVGNTGFIEVGDSQSDMDFDLAIDNNDIPYVLYQKDGSRKATMQKYYQGEWGYVGSYNGFSASSSYYNSIAVDSTNAPYAFYQNGTTGKANVMKYDGSSWTSVGDADFTTDSAWYTSLAIDKSDTPYVVFKDKANEEKATVMKFDGSSWVNVENAGFSPIEASYTEIAIDNSTGSPFVLYSTYSNGNEKNVTVMSAPDVTCKRFDQETGDCTPGTADAPVPQPYPSIPYDGNYDQGDGTDEGDRIADPGWTDPYPEIPCGGTHEQGTDECASP